MTELTNQEMNTLTNIMVGDRINVSGMGQGQFVGRRDDSKIIVFTDNRFEKEYIYREGTSSLSPERVRPIGEY